jgi:hypothetical protein
MIAEPPRRSWGRMGPYALACMVEAYLGACDPDAPDDVVVNAVLAALEVHAIVDSVVVHHSNGITSP